MPYRKLFEKGQIGSLTLKNRAVMMPMATDLADKDGIVSGRQIKYYQRRAEGGVAMIIHEYTGVDDIDSIPSIHNLRIARDYHISEMEKLVDVVHMYDCLIIAQLHHGGATSNPALTGRDNLAPSAVPIAEGRPVPKEMTIEDIRRIQEKFVDAAVRCKKAGYDGVELHGAHGYLVAQFFSKYYNRRKDAYGGSVENRCRFLAEIIAGIRKKLGNYPIIVRMCGDEMTPTEGFLSVEEGIEIARYLEGCGIDALNISMGSARNGDANCEPFSYQSGWKKHVAKAYRQTLSIPIIATNTIKDPVFAEQLLEEGVCDFVGLGRSLLADPDFVKKARAGREETIRECIGCLYCRERVIRDGLPIRCEVNAVTGREDELYLLRKDGKGRKAAVIGAGPAGMEAARVLALRGFSVDLYEKEARPGGMLNVADQPPYKEKLTKLVRSMQAQLSDLNVNIHLGAEVMPETIQSKNYEGIIVAIGAEPIFPRLPGAEQPHVVQAQDVIMRKVKPEGTVAVIGSGLTGLEVSEMLLEWGYPTAIVEMADEIGPGIYANIRNDELSRILPKHPELYPGHRLVSIGTDHILARRCSDGKEVAIGADTVVLALGTIPKKDIVKTFENAYKKVSVIGDAKKAGNIADAIRQGYEAAFCF